MAVGIAGAFELDRVVDTPRRARASIGKRVDHDIAARDQLGQTVRFGPAHFALRDKLDVAVAPLEQLTDELQKFVGIGLVVVEQTDAQALEAVVLAPSETGLLARALLLPD